MDHDHWYRDDRGWIVKVPFSLGKAAEAYESFITDLSLSGQFNEDQHRQITNKLHNEVLIWIRGERNG